MKFELGMTSVTFREKSIGEIASLAKTAGLSAIEWGADRHVLPLDLDAVKTARTEMEKNGLLCSSYGSYYRMIEKDEDSFRAVCKTAEALGAGIVRAWLGRTGSERMTPRALCRAFGGNEKACRHRRRIRSDPRLRISRKNAQ